MSTVTASARMSELAALVGEKNVVEAPAKLSDFAIDGVKPAISVSPGTAEEVAAVLRYAYEHDLVVVPAGGFVHQEIGNAPTQIDVLLGTERLTTIEHYDPGDLTIGIGAGSTLGEIQSLVRDQGQMFPLDIAHADRITLGGAMAVSAQGPMKHAFGGLREFCIGVRFVTADGVAAKGGGRVVKNVAGFDLMRLMIGSFGTLGVITSASFKLFPQPRVTRTYVCKFATLEEVLACRDAVMNSPLSPLCLELLSPKATKVDGWTVAVRAGGSEPVLARYAGELGSRVSEALDAGDEQRFWANVEALGQDAPVVVKISLPPASISGVVESIERSANESGLNFVLWGRAGIGSLYAAFDSGMAENYIATVAAVRNVLARNGSLVVTRCPSALKTEMNVWGASPTNFRAMATAKRALSPKDNLNRGRFLL